MVSRTTNPKPVLDKRSILQAHPLFGKLGPRLIERLASYAHTRKVRNGATIFQRGDPGDCLFAVCAGTIRISNRSADGKDVVFNLIGPGGIFGEIGIARRAGANRGRAGGHRLRCHGDRPARLHLLALERARAGAAAD